MNALRRLFGAGQSAREALPALALAAVRRTAPNARVEYDPASYALSIDGRRADLEPLLLRYTAETTENRYPLVDAWARSVAT